jgi:hypothetical protein
MNVTLPDGDGYSGTVIDGWRRAGGAEQRVWSVVVKRSYRVAGAALEPDAGGEAMRFADAADPATGETLHEADIAAFKPEADIVVKGHVADPASGGLISIDGVVRQLRLAAAPAASDADARRHLFGFEQRAGATRRAEAGDWEAEPAPLPSGYANGFANVHRRSGLFAATPPARLPAGGAVSVFRTPDASDAAYALTLALPALSARRLTYCGTGPDRDARWRAEPVGGLVPDTLVIEPEADRAYVLWRAVWPYAARSLDLYRRVDVLEEAA